MSIGLVVNPVPEMKAIARRRQYSQYSAIFEDGDIAGVLDNLALLLDAKRLRNKYDLIILVDLRSILYLNVSFLIS